MYTTNAYNDDKYYIVFPLCALVHRISMQLFIGAQRKLSSYKYSKNTNSQNQFIKWFLRWVTLNNLPDKSGYIDCWEFSAHMF